MVWAEGIARRDVLKSAWRRRAATQTEWKQGAIVAGLAGRAGQRLWARSGTNTRTNRGRGGERCERAGCEVEEACGRAE